MLLEFKVNLIANFNDVSGFGISCYSWNNLWNLEPEKGERQEEGGLSQGVENNKRPSRKTPPSFVDYFFEIGGGKFCI